ncbi:cysteine hydrolase family protein [[Eubacterium] cellulosolvens]
MNKSNQDKIALIVVDMQIDNVGRYCQHIIPKIKTLITKVREKKIPVIYACDSRYPDDLLFEKLGRKPHTIRGTEGVKVIKDLTPLPDEIIVEKRMMSGFFGSELDFTLRQKSIKRLIITGVRTEFCLLKTILDAFELGYELIVPSDACASPSEKGHRAALESLDLLKITKPTTEELIKNYLI